MSTRCQIGIYDEEGKDLNKYQVLLYRHSDGYPEGESGVVHDILPFLKRFAKERGLSDTQYCGAWLIHHLIDLHIKTMKKLAKEMALANNLSRDGKNFLGHGISNCFHWDIEYFYAVRFNTLEVYEVIKQDKDFNKCVKLIKAIPLN